MGLKTVRSICQNCLPFLFTFPMLYLAASCEKERTVDRIFANTKRASIQVENQKRSRGWTIAPEVNPDIFPLEMEKGERLDVTFMTDMDTITYNLGEGETKDLLVILKDGDTAYTRFQSVPPKAIFTNDYINKNRRRSSVEVVEAQELLQVIFAITETGLKDTNSLIINHDSTDYYLDVIKEFLPHKKEPIVTIMDSLLKKRQYIRLKANACSFYFNEDGVLKKSKTYDRMTGSFNPLDRYLPLLNDFAVKSNFRDFYDKNRRIYDSLITWHKTAVPTMRQWDWLEQQFPDHRYDNYWITFSPLVKGNHSTVRFNHNGFKQAVMFTRPPYRVKGVSKEISEGLITRNVFTEIDHNYVNPETDKYMKQVNEFFKDRDLWTSGKESSGYNSPYTIFNEYMTWSVYLLFCYDQFDSEDFKLINERIVSYIVNRRGFSRFDDFHGTLLGLYSRRTPGTTVADLYIPLLEWAATYRPDVPPLVN
ncbi:MAG: DUF4932 domain-containing protein [Bacteroidota bacterium]